MINYFIIIKREKKRRFSLGAMLYIRHILHYEYFIRLKQRLFLTLRNATITV